MADGDTIIEGPLYAARKKVYPQAVHGTFRRIKWAILVFTLAVYYLLPFVRWDRGPNLPDQAVLVDLPHRRFYFFFIELWPQEVYYFTGLLILAAMTLFLMNAVAGRLWCGYLCPQTVWTDLFYAVERLIEGDRRDRIKADKGSWSARAGRAQGAQAFYLADDRLVDRWRVGALLRGRSNPGPRPRDLPGALVGLSLDRDPDFHDLRAGRPHARTGVHLHVPLAAYPGRADRRVGAERHLSRRSRRAEDVAQESRPRS